MIIFVVICVAVGGGAVFYMWKNNADDLKVESGKTLDSSAYTIPKNKQADVKTKLDILEENLKKGHEFEKFIVPLFNKEYFKLKVWQGDKKADNGVYADSNRDPDMLFCYKPKYGREHHFAVECKWRKGFTEGKVKWAHEYQINRYMEYQQENRLKVFVIIGIGGTPNNPEEVYVVRLDHISDYPFLYNTYLQKYKRKTTTARFFYDPVNKVLG